MYNIIKQNIKNGGFKLSDIQHKAKKLYLMGDIDETQLDELLNLATNGASPDGERPNQDAMLKAVYEMYVDLDRRVKILEDEYIEEDEPIEGDDTVVEITYPAWEPWNGLNDNYQFGEILTHKGEIWKSTYNGQNVWEPGAPGIDERYWIKYDPNAETEEPETEPETEASE